MELGRMEQERHYFMEIEIKCKRVTVALILSGQGISVAGSNMRIISNLQTMGLQTCLHISLLAMANQGFFQGKNKFQNISFVNPCQNQEQLAPCRGKPKQNHTMSPLSLTSPPQYTPYTHSENLMLRQNTDFSFSQSVFLM